MASSVSTVTFWVPEALLDRGRGDADLPAQGGNRQAVGRKQPTQLLRQGRARAV